MTPVKPNELLGARLGCDRKHSIVRARLIALEILVVLSKRQIREGVAAAIADIGSDG
ncbi:MAG: hypothetical protein RLO48_12170 [Bauldia litoralis]